MVNTPSLRSVGIPEAADRKAESSIVVVLLENWRDVEQVAVPCGGIKRRGTPPIAAVASVEEGAIVNAGSARQTFPT